MAKWTMRLWGGAVLAAIRLTLSILLQAQTAPPVRPAWAAQVDRVFAEWDRPDSPGCAVALYKDGKAVYKHDKAYRTR